MRNLLVLLFAIAWGGSAGEDGWTHYGSDAGGSRYSPLKQITPANVQQLKVAWTYHTGALQPDTDLNKKAAFEATPILVNGLLYLSTPFNQVIALDPATGAERWKYDPKIDRSKDYSEVASRGVSAWTDSKTRQTRIVFGTVDARLIALDASTGKLCREFGSGGQVDLSRDVMLRDGGDYQVTSPPAIYGDLIITGSSIGDNRAVDVESGIVRAFEARTGQLRWTWDPAPWAAKTSPRTGAANAWSVLSVDAERGLVFVPTGSASPDFYGGLRPGHNKHANSVVALNAKTGEVVWGFQVVHHDLWDYDVASQPSLFTWKGQPAVAVNTKMGFVFVLNRLTGKPLFPVEERAVPKSDVPGEEASPTQPFPATDALVPNQFTATDAWGINDADRDWCRERLKPLRAEGIYTPPSLKGSIAFPGNVGGVNWGSAAVDLEHGIMVANTNRVSTILRLIPRDQYVGERTAAAKNRMTGEFGKQTGAPYAVYREFLLAPGSRLPCNAPPWGTVTAMDLNTGKKIWETPLGSFVPGATDGALNLGGPMLTAGGLVFTAAVSEPALRAFDLKDGKELWKAELPASAQATPMTYSVGGKQYVLICAGGHGKLGSKMGDSVVAFTLSR